jgi:hypothetical protein
LAVAIIFSFSSLTESFGSVVLTTAGAAAALATRAARLAALAKAVFVFAAGLGAAGFSIFLDAAAGFFFGSAGFGRHCLGRSRLDGFHLRGSLGISLLGALGGFVGRFSHLSRSGYNWAHVYAAVHNSDAAWPSQLHFVHCTMMTGETP